MPSNKLNQNGRNAIFKRYMRKKSTGEAKIIILGGWRLDKGMHRFHAYSALNRIMFNKKFPLNFIKMSEISTLVWPVKSTRKSKFAISGKWGLREVCTDFIYFQC